MARHRNVRSMNYADEYDGYDDVYGHSVEDDYSISPSDVGYVYNRDQKAQMSAFVTGDEDIAEEDEDLEEGNEAKKRRDSECLGIQLRNLSDVDAARLQSCLDEIRNVIGDTVSEATLVDIVLAKNFDVAASLDAVLSNASPDVVKPESVTRNQGTPLPPREPKTVMEKDDNATSISSLRHRIQVLGLDSQQDNPASKKTTLPRSFKIPKLPKLRLESEKENLSSEVAFSLSSPFCQTQGQDIKNVGNMNANSQLNKFPSGSVLSKMTFGTSAELKWPHFDLNISPLRNSIAARDTLSVKDMQGEDSDEECTSLSALMAQHSFKSKEPETTSLSALAESHLRGNIGKHVEKPKLLVPSFGSRKTSDGKPQGSLGLQIPTLRPPGNCESLIIKREGGEPEDQDIDSDGSVELTEENDDFVFDLQSALNPPDTRRHLERPQSQIGLLDEDVDVEESVDKPWVHDHTCVLDARAVLFTELEIEEKRSSSLGYVLCRRRNVWFVPYIRPSTPMHSNLIPFMFNTPSPDSLVLKHLRRIL